MIDKKIWSSIGGKNPCAFKMHTKTALICKNKYNLTGLCNEFSCPFANPEYATVRMLEDEIFLCIKNKEKLDKPQEMWEMYKLGYDYKDALNEIDNKLNGYSKETIDKCKNRLTQHFECLERMIEMEKAPESKLVVRKKKMSRREKARAIKALNTINFEKEIGEEIMQRLKDGVYGEDKKELAEITVENAKKYKAKKYVADIEESETRSKKKPKQRKGKKKETIEW